MTFLQRTLGRNYKWWYITKYALLSESGDRLGFIAKYFGQILFIITNSYVWFLAGSNTEIFTYLLVGKIYFELTSNNYYYRLSNLIITGKIYKILYPINFFGYQYFEAIGTRLLKNTVSIGGSLIGVMICILTFAKVDLPSLQIFLLLPFSLIAFTIYQNLGIIIGSAAFWLKNPNNFDGIQQSAGSIITVFSGLIIPLTKMPLWVGDFLSLLPFSFLVHHPMQIYLGKYSQTETIQTFAGGIAWCIVLWILARFVFKAGLKKNEAVGL